MSKSAMLRINAKAATIAAKLAGLVPGLDTTPEFAWTGAFGTTPTGLPIIGPVGKAASPP